MIQTRRYSLIQTRRYSLIQTRKGDGGPITLKLTDCGVNSTQCEGDLIVSLRGMADAVSVTIGSGNIAWKEVAVKWRARRQVETLYVESETEALLVDARLTVSKVKLLLVRGGERRVEVSVRCRMVDKFDENALSVALTAGCNRRDGLGCTEFGFGIGGGGTLMMRGKSTEMPSHVPSARKRQ